MLFFAMRTRWAAAALLGASAFLAGAVGSPTAAYDVRQTAPKSIALGTLAVGWAPEGTVLMFHGPGQTRNAIFRKDMTLLWDGPPPTLVGFIEPARRSGYVPLVPPVSGFVGWPTVFLEHGTHHGRVADMDVVADAVRPYSEPAEVLTTRVGNRVLPATVRVIHNGRTACVWEFRGYRALSGRLIPTRIERRRYRSSGLNIPTDDQTVWTLREISSHVPSTADTAIFKEGALVQDNRLRPNIARFRFDPRGGSLDDQSKAAGLELAGAEGPGGFMSLLAPLSAALVGGGIGAAAWRRNRTMK